MNQKIGAGRQWSGRVEGLVSYSFGYRPAAPQRLVEAHMVRRDRSGGGGHTLLREQQRALRLQHSLKVDEPAAVALL